MKHFINILVILILVGFAIGITWLIRTEQSELNAWGVLYVPLIAFMLMFGNKINKNYP